MTKLFAGKKLSAFLEERMNEVEREVHSMMSGKSDQEITELSFNKFKIELPIFNSSESRQSEVTPDTLNFYFSCNGDDFLWDCEPNLYQQNNTRYAKPTAERLCDEESGKNKVKIPIKHKGLSESQIKEQYKNQINLVQKHLGASCSEISVYNKELADNIKNWLAQGRRLMTIAERI